MYFLDLICFKNKFTNILSDAHKLTNQLEKNRYYFLFITLIICAESIVKPCYDWRFKEKAASATSSTCTLSQKYLESHNWGRCFGCHTLYYASGPEKKPDRLSFYVDIQIIFGDSTQYMYPASKGLSSLLTGSDRQRKFSPWPGLVKKG